MKVLVADDDKMYLSMIRRFLTQWGFEIETAADGLSALKIIDSEAAPEIAILDWNMPEMTGPDVCRAVRAQKSDHYVYLLLVTGNTDTGHLIEGLESGADDYIGKPFEPGELFARLKTGERTVKLHRALHNRIQDLQNALKHIKTLQGLLPICSHCRKVRDDKGYWSRLEEYVVQHSDTDFTHGICPDCLKAHYPEIYARRAARNSESAGA